MIGGVIALRGDTGDEAWRDDFGATRGAVRSSPAVADINNDGTPDVLIGIGCDGVAPNNTGPIYAYNGITGALEWRKNLGPNIMAAPSIGDLNNNGTLEIVVASYDGKVYALGGVS